MGWSISKVQRIESGDNAVSGTDLRALLDLYGVTDMEEIEQLSEEARISRRQRWWTTPEFRQHLTPAMMQYLQFEAEAVAIRTYQPVIVPGLFQAPAYASFVLNFFGASLNGDEQRVRLDVRVRRQNQILAAGDGPRNFVILDESVLKREIGGPEVMADQLDQLVDIAGKPNVNIRIIPFDQGAILGLGGHFEVIELSEDDLEDAVLYRESFTKDSLDHDAKEVAFHREMFEKFWERSLNEEKTVRAIAAEAASLRARIDRS